MRRRLHRAAGILMAVPLLLWMATGLLFHVKHRYAEAYEQLAVPASGLAWDQVPLSPADLVARGALDPGAPVALLAHPRGAMVYVGSRAGVGVAVDGATGAVLSTADREEARGWAARAVAASPHAARYGSPSALEGCTRTSALTGVDHPSVRVRFSGGKVVTVDRVTGEISQTGDLNDWIDLTYRVHYLQWTPWQPANVALVLVAMPAGVALAISGLWLAFLPRGR